MDEQNFKTVISSETKIIDLHIKETLDYKDLIFLFVKRDFISRYKQTILGPLWAIIQPLLTTVVFTIIFGSLANLTTLDVTSSERIIIPGFLFYMAGTICWSYFSSTVSSTARTFISNSSIMGKVYFPRLVSPISTTLSNLISFAIQFVMFIGFLVFYLIKGHTSIQVTGYSAFLPLIILQASGYFLFMDDLNTEKHFISKENCAIISKVCHDT